MSRTLMSLAAGLLTACVAPAPEAHAPPPPPDPAVVRTAIENLGQQYKVYMLNGDAMGISSLFTDDGRFEAYGFPSMAGRQAIAEGLKAGFEAAKFKVWDVSYNEAGPLGPDIATGGGTVHEQTEVSGKETHAWYRWAAAYRRGADGHYKIAFLMAFPDSTR
jgi:ketosteroid isomerase-like protein